MPTNREIKAWITRMEKAKAKVAAGRDELRAIYHELDEPVDTCDRGVESLDEAIEALSELV